jgi:hypothetical protein
MFPLGLLAAACGGGDDGGLTTRDNSSDTTDEDASDTTEDDSSDTTEEPTDTTEDDSSDTTEETFPPDDTTEETFPPDDTTEDTSEETTGETFDTTDITNPDGTLTDEVRDSAIEGLTQSGFTEEQAGCLIDQMVELLGVDALIEIGLAGGGGDAALDALTPEQTTQLVEAVFACDIDPTQLG